MRGDVAAAVAGGVALAGGAASAGVAWWMHRRTNLSPRNLYLAWLAGLLAAAGAGWAGKPVALVGVGPVAFALGVAAVLARRWRVGALGAGGELREFELARVMAWSPHRRLSARASAGERVYIASQGQLVRERAWPRGVRALPMTADGRGLLPLGEGLHLYFVGATGAGKTTSARRWLLARGLAEPDTALLALDPKGDAALERDLRAIAAHTGRPFVLFDPFDDATDRWNPIWADEPGAVVARLVAPVEANPDSDASHYSRLLRVHLGLVAEALKTAGCWPVALGVLLRAAHRARFARIATLAREHGASTELLERVADHAEALGERSTQGQLDGSLRALEVVCGQAWRRLLTPLPDRGAVTLPAAMAAGAVVLFKTHVEDIKEEAETITTLALADIGAAARTLPAGAQWALLIDEFGSVLQGRAGDRAVALMQRARSTGGQVAVSTQSVSDVPSATANVHLLASLTDNFAGFVLHRQTSPESRDWLSKLLGTRELWQSTDRTSHGRGDGTGSRRRAAEFIVRPDDFRQLPPGEAVIWSTLGPAPERVTVTPAAAPRLAERDAAYRPLRAVTLDELLAGAPQDASDAPRPASQAAVNAARGPEPAHNAAPIADTEGTSWLG